MLSRRPTEDFDAASLGLFLGSYFVLASLTFGVALPSGNFVPGICIGACLGRLFGQLLADADLHAGWSPGAYALLGAAAVLSGMTRMSLTLAAILVEVADDMRMMPALMIVLALSRMAGALVAPSIDEIMLELQGLPFLEEAPPEGFKMLTARDAMARSVTTLPEVVQVRFLPIPSDVVRFLLIPSDDRAARGHAGRHTHRCAHLVLAQRLPGDARACEQGQAAAER